MDDDGDNITEPLIMALLLISIVKLRRLVSNFNLCQYLDYVLHDIPPEEEEATIIFKLCQNVVFESWSDWDCYHYTNFHKEQLAGYFVTLDF